MGEFKVIYLPTYTTEEFHVLSIAITFRILGLAAGCTHSDSVGLLQISYIHTLHLEGLLWISCGLHCAQKLGLGSR